MYGTKRINHLCDWWLLLDRNWTVLSGGRSCTTKRSGSVSSKSNLLHSKSRLIWPLQGYPRLHKNPELSGPLSNYKSIYLLCPWAYKFLKSVTFSWIPHCMQEKSRLCESTRKKIDTYQYYGDFSPNYFENRLGTGATSGCRPKYLIVDCAILAMIEKWQSFISKHGYWPSINVVPT
jgi:hypothetical protein